MKSYDKGRNILPYLIITNLFIWTLCLGKYSSEWNRTLCEYMREQCTI